MMVFSTSLWGGFKDVGDLKTPKIGGNKSHERMNLIFKRRWPTNQKLPSTKNDTLGGPSRTSFAAWYRESFLMDNPKDQMPCKSNHQMFLYVGLQTTISYGKGLSSPKRNHLKKWWQRLPGQKSVWMGGFFFGILISWLMQRIPIRTG